MDKFLTLPRLELRPLGRPASRYTDCATTAVRVVLRLNACAVLKGEKCVVSWSPPSKRSECLLRRASRYLSLHARSTRRLYHTPPVTRVSCCTVSVSRQAGRAASNAICWTEGAMCVQGSAVSWSSSGGHGTLATRIAALETLLT
jgi:hypothetical protein